jgi:hypothetical protein
MDLEEQRLKQHIQDRETALREKVGMVKDRLERTKRLADVKFLVGQRPGLMMAGSVLMGAVLRRLTNRKGRPYYANDAAHPEVRNSTVLGSNTAPARLWEPVVGILSAVATRAAIGMIGEIGKTFGRRKQRAKRSRQIHSDGDSRD